MQLNIKIYAQIYTSRIKQKEVIQLFFQVDVNFY